MDDINKKSQKRFIITILLLIFALLLTCTAALAWFVKMRKIETAAQIAAPNPMAIKAGNQSDPLLVNIPSINLADENGKSTFVFSILSNVPVGSSYNIILAHTTNIPVSYNIYPVTSVSATRPVSGTYGEYKDLYFYMYDQNSCLNSISQTEYMDSSAYASDSEEVKAQKMEIYKYSNKADNGDTAVVDTADPYFSATYNAGETANKVQKNAMPLYWIGAYFRPNDNRYETFGNPGGLYKYIDYFVLVVDWSDFSGTADTYSKETDMVYLLAGTS